jgi:hypothetical protein
MATHTFNYPLFQQQVPAMASSPDESVLQVYFDMATTFANNGNDSWCGGFNGSTLDLILNLLTAHIAQIQNLIAAGQTQISITTGAGIDKVNVSLMQPPVKNMFQYWLATTPYGEQVLAMARMQFAGGFYAAVGNFERHGFRKVGGRFR